MLVHPSCRKRYTDLRKTSSSPCPAKKVKTTRSSISKFDWKTLCALCAEICEIDERNTRRDKESIRRVETIELRSKILERCEKESTAINETFSITEIKHRMLSCFDFVAAEAVYHKKCHLLFFKTPTNLLLGWPVNDLKLETFEELCEDLEFCAEPATVTALRQNLVAEHGEEAVYSKKWIKEKLKERYGDNITMTDDRYSTIACLKNVASAIINEKWYANRKDDINEERDRIILTAAKLINQEIRDAKFNTDIYHTETNICDVKEGTECIPKSLLLLLKKLIPSEIKQTSIGQSIIYAARPRSTIPSLLFGIGVELEHVFGSRWLVDELYRLGFSISHEKVIRFKQSVLQSEDYVTNIPHHPLSFTQW